MDCKARRLASSYKKIEVKVNISKKEKEVMLSYSGVFKGNWLQCAVREDK